MRITLNASACAALLEDVKWGEPRLLLSLSVLALINVMVIVGNCLVIAAVFCSSKLRSVTNLFIVSLAVADLLVGVAVLPFSATWEVFKTEDDTTNTTQPEDLHCPWKCELTNEAGYVVYSALGSFYIPMFVMLFFYWRIYRAAIRTTRAINQGFRTTKGSRNRFDEQRLTLRIHRGRGSSTKRHHGSPHSNGSNSTTTTTGSVSPSPSTRAKHERVKISVSYPSSDTLSPPPNPHLLAVTPSSPTGPTASYAVHYSVNGKDATTALCRRENQLRVHRLSSRRRASRRSSSCESTERAPSPCPSSCEDGKKVISRRMGKRNIKAQVKRFRMETKAAKTLAIIVGGFIFCWLPFFTMYLVRAFCKDCIHSLVFSILFWLGYCNSAINPLIYALFSKDFRFAFKRIICKCFCKRKEVSGRRGSDGSQLQGRQFRSPSYNVQQHEQGNSLGDDSDPGADPSDSR
ncbi:octopamine receptor Oamb isoform X2 [Zophobas morio]|uniref:octopamine receptor Oamb isoform X2 n=1 Tax=Zophobas morio TaxID=2755281 RepID=UPI003082FCA7